MGFERFLGITSLWKAKRQTAFFQGMGVKAGKMWHGGQ